MAFIRPASKLKAGPAGLSVEEGIQRRLITVDEDLVAGAPQLDAFQNDGSEVRLADEGRTDSFHAPIRVYPRPDEETASWAKHRMHTPAHAYECPVGVMFGNPPLNFEVLIGPSGLTVGNFLPIFNDIYDTSNPGRYGIVDWSNPTVGVHPIVIRVKFQGTVGSVGCPAPGYIDVDWTLTVTDQNTLYVDSSVAPGGDGTENDPFQSVREILGPNLSDRNYSGTQVCFRGGTHVAALTSAINGGATGGNWVLNSDDKPLVYYGHPDETAIIDMTDTTINAGTAAGGGSHPSGSDFAWFNLITNGGPLTRNNPRLFFWRNFAVGDLPYPGYSAGGSRWAFHNSTFRNMVVTTTSADNSAIFWCANRNPNRRHFGYISRVTFENCGGAAAGLNYNGFYVSNGVNILEEFTKCIDTEFGKASVVGKTGTRGSCHRYLDYSQAPDQRHAVYVAGSYDGSAGGPVEVWYLKVNNANVGAGGNTTDAVGINGGTDPFDALDDGHYPINYMRCNVSRVPQTGNTGGFRILSNWQGRTLNCIVAAPNRFRNANNAVVLDDSGPTFSVADDPFDSDMNLAPGTARDTYLGIDGAEIAVAQAL